MDTQQCNAWLKGRSLAVENACMMSMEQGTTESCLTLLALCAWHARHEHKNLDKYAAAVLRLGAYSAGVEAPAQLRLTGLQPPCVLGLT